MVGGNAYGAKLRGKRIYILIICRVIIWYRVSQQRRYRHFEQTLSSLGGKCQHPWPLPTSMS